MCLTGNSLVFPALTSDANARLISEPKQNILFSAVLDRIIIVRTRPKAYVEKNNLDFFMKIAFVFEKCIMSNSVTSTIKNLTLYVYT